MGKFVKGDIVVIPFPYTDLTHVKRRPALVLKGFDRAELVLAQINSRNPDDAYHVFVNEKDFVDGALFQPSFIRYNHIFTFDETLILYKIASLKSKKMKQVIDALVSMFSV